MNKDEAVKQAKRAVRFLRKEAIGWAKRHGDSNRHRGRSTGELMKLLEIETTGWDQRAKVKGALTRALKEAVDLGLIERVPYVSEARWRYVGPEVAKAAKEHAKHSATERRTLIQNLRTLGFPIKAANGAYAPDDRVELCVKDIRRVAERMRRRQG